MNVKTIIAPIVICLGIITTPLTAKYQEVFGRSFMYTRPAYEPLALNQAGWHNIVYNKQGNNSACARAVGFYQQSVPLKRTTHYFLPFCQTTLLVAGDSTVANYRDYRQIRAEWLGLDSTFVGTFCLKPTQKQYGAFIEFNQDLQAWTNSEFLSNYWFGIKIPIECVENNLHMEENIINQSATYPHTLIQAFNQDAWCYGKLTPYARKRIQPAEIRLTLGSTLADEDYFQFAYNSIFVIPTGNKPDGKELFGAVVGNNLHAGVGAAIFFQLPLNCDTTAHAWCLFANLESIFLIRNHQNRTYSLRKKPWSRFMLYNEIEPGGLTNIPGVNILTISSMVKPYGVFDFSTGFRYISEHVECEFGYNVWGKDAETVYPREKFDFPCNKYGPFGIAGNAPRTTASFSTIKEQTVNDEFPIPVRDIDLDLYSAAGGSILNHKLHIALTAMTPQYTVVAPCVTLGFFYDIPQKNAAFEAWGLWLSIAASF